MRASFTRRIARGAMVALLAGALVASAANCQEEDDGFDPLLLALLIPRTLDPRTISGLRLWLRSDAGITRFTGINGSNRISAWEDQSGAAAASTFTQATTAQMPLFAGGVLNGWPTLVFDGVDDSVARTITGTDVFATDRGTIFIVQAQDSGQARNETLVWAASGTNVVALGLSDNDNLSYSHGNPVQTTGALVSGAQPAAWDNSFHVVEAYHGAPPSAGSAVAEIVVDGTRAVSGTMATTLNTALSSSLIVGGRSTAPFKGQIAEILIYNTALSTAERNAVTGYLGGRYGLATAQ